MILWLSYNLLDFLEKEVKQTLPKETGGILMGYISFNDYIITHIIGPGPNAIHETNKFIPDHEYQCAEITKHFIRTIGRETYLGDWHSHPNATAYLSKQDITTLTHIAEFKEARIPNPIMLVFGTKPKKVKCWRYINKKKLEVSKIRYYNDLNTLT